MEKIIKAGYGYKVKTCVVSIYGVYTLNFWGCACPLWWISPSYDMEAIINHGEFGTVNRIVIAQEDTFENLENQLLKKAKEKFPKPFELSNGKDVRRVYSELYSKALF